MADTLPKSLRLEWMNPATLADNPRNWRKHPKAQTEALSAALEAVGWAGALLYNEATNRLIDGHARKGVSVAPGGEVPVLVGSWTEEQEALILATLDPLAAMAEADSDALGKLLQEVSPTDDERLGAMLAELASGEGIELAGGGTPAEDPGPQPDRAKELQAKWGTATGQLWVIPSKATSGKEHRLLCGDSTKAGDVARVMAGEKADLCFTSPPYDQQREYEGGIGDWLTLMKGVFGNLPMADAGQVLVNLGLIHREGEWVPYWEPWIEWMRGEGWRRFGWYVWDQGFGLPGDWNGRLAPSHEFVFHFNREAVKPGKWVEKKPENIRPRNEGESTMRGKDGKMKAFTNPGASGQPTKIPDSVIRVGRQVGSDGHPAQFPTEFPVFAMKCWPGIAYEPFMGSGTTLVAAEQTGRLARGIEVAPAYVAVALERLAGMELQPRLADGPPL